MLNGDLNSITLGSVISIFDIEDVDFLPPFFLTFNLYIFYAFCEDFKSIPCLEKSYGYFVGPRYESFEKLYRNPIEILIKLFLS